MYVLLRLQLTGFELLTVFSWHTDTHVNSHKEEMLCSCCYGCLILLNSCFIAVSLKSCTVVALALVVCQLCDFQLHIAWHVSVVTAWTQFSGYMINVYLGDLRFDSCWESDQTWQTLAYLSLEHRSVQHSETSCESIFITLLAAVLLVRVA